MIFFMVLLVSLFRHTRRARRESKGVLAANVQQLKFLELGLFAFFVQGIFGSYSYLNFPYVYMGILYCCAETLRSEARTLKLAAAAPTPPVPAVRRPPAFHRG
jgi:hypothetical protein